MQQRLLMALVSFFVMAAPVQAGTVFEHYAAPKTDGDGFQCRAFRIQPADGSEYKVRIRFIGNAGVLDGHIDLDKTTAKKLLLEGTQALEQDEAATASPADIYEYRTPIGPDLEIRYIIDKIAKEKVVHIKGTNIFYKNALELYAQEFGAPIPKEAFRAMLTTLKTALDKAPN